MRTPGLARYDNRNWRNEETTDAWYLTANRHRLTDGSYCSTSLAIVPRNRTSHPVCEDNAKYLVACWNACNRLGLTAEQLDAGVLEEVIAAARAVIEPSPLGPKVDWAEDGSPIIDAHESCKEFAENWNRLEKALRPFTKEPRDDGNI